MASSKKKVSPFNPNTTLGSTQAAKAMRYRQAFENDLTPPDPSVASDLLQQLWSVHYAAVLEDDLQKKLFARQQARARKRYAGKPTKPKPEPVRKVAASAARMSNSELFFNKLQLLDWDTPQKVRKQGDRFVVKGLDAGLEKTKSEIDNLLHEGVSLQAKRVIDRVNQQLGDDAIIPVANESGLAFKGFDPRQRFNILDKFHGEARDGTPDDAIACLLRQQELWRTEQSFHACRRLWQFELEISDRTKFPASIIAALRRRYHFGRLPAFAHLKHIGADDTRLAISIQASRQVRPKSSILRLDLKFAQIVAEKYDAFHQALATVRKSHNQPLRHIPLILLEYQKLV